VSGTRHFLAGNGNSVYGGGKRHKRLRGADGGEARVERLCSPGKVQRGWQRATRRWCWSVTRSHISARSCATRALGERGCDVAKTDAWRCDWPRWTGARGEGTSAVRLGRGWKWAREEELTRAACMQPGLRQPQLRGREGIVGDSSPKREQKFRSESNAQHALDSSIRSLAQCRLCALTPYRTRRWRAWAAGSCTSGKATANLRYLSSLVDGVTKCGGRSRRGWTKDGAARSRNPRRAKHRGARASGGAKDEW
jgi:hypothetical protein